MQNKQKNIGRLFNTINAEEEKTLRNNTKEILSDKKKINNSFLPAEWQEQSAIQLTWPHQNTDWAYMLNEVTDCFKNLANEIATRQPLIIVTPEPQKTRQQLGNLKNITFFKCPTNDTWARDHGFITMLDETGPTLLDFRFNGWGQKFASNLDNQICRKMAVSGIMNGKYKNCLDFVLEGGSIESDGCGTLLTTTACLTAPNRNEPLSKDQIEEHLKQEFNLKQVLWLDHGYLLSMYNAAIIQMSILMNSKKWKSS